MFILKRHCMHVTSGNWHVVWHVQNWLLWYLELHILKRRITDQVSIWRVGSENVLLMEVLVTIPTIIVSFRRYYLFDWQVSQTPTPLPLCLNQTQNKPTLFAMDNMKPIVILQSCITMLLCLSTDWHLSMCPHACVCISIEVCGCVWVCLFTSVCSSVSCSTRGIGGLSV